MRHAIGPALLLGLLAPGPLASQSAEDPQARAREIQARFERQRVAALPLGWPRPRSAADEVVGRLVLLDDGPEDEPPPEPVAIGRARDALIGALDSLALADPADGWIAGLLVHYLVEADRPDDAVARLAGCGAVRWWCRALAGYALHAAGRTPAAETAFADALADMPAGLRERWLDLEPLLDGPARERWRELDRAGRHALAERFWWLADPLWSVAGNDRRTAHLARHVQARVLEDARNPFRLGWGDDLGEVLVRYGWPIGWERSRPRTGPLGSSGAAVVGLDPPAERAFDPPPDALFDPFAVAPEGWTLDAAGARSTYATVLADRVVALEHQLAAFRRGEATVVVAAWAPDSFAEPAGAIVVGWAPDSTAASAPGRGRARLAVPRGPAVVSVEVVGEHGDPAGRARYGLPSTGRAGRFPALSDLLLVDAGAPLPADLDVAFVRARGSTRVAAGERVGVFWELYPAPGRPLAAALSIRLIDVERGFWHRVGGALGLGGGPETAELAWVELIPAGTEVHPRAVTVALPDLSPGTYALELEVRAPDSSRAVARREIRVER